MPLTALLHETGPIYLDLECIESIGPPVQKPGRPAARALGMRSSQRHYVLDCKFNMAALANVLPSQEDIAGALEASKKLVSSKPRGRGKKKDA